MLIRSARLEDAAALLQIYRHYVLHTAVTFEYEVPSVEEFRQRISRVQTKYPYLVAEENGELIGYAYAVQFHSRPAYGWGAELSVYVHKDQRGKSIGKRLYEATEEALKCMGVVNLYACIASPEQEDEFLTFASERFHEHMGFVKNAFFQKCGYKFGRWYGMIWMEKLIGDHVPNQPPVKPYSEIESKQEEEP